MTVNDLQAKQYLQALYHTAAKDHNDVIANAASALASRLEHVSYRGHVLNAVEQRIIRYAIQMKPEQPDIAVERRKTYKRRV